MRDCNPGFLIGGVPQNFGVSARLTDSPFFVIEADEYDTAFFDKRSKFVHYRPRTAILNNLEFDHADIFPDLAAIETQFHHLVRTVPGNGLIVANGARSKPGPRARSAAAGPRWNASAAQVAGPPAKSMQMATSTSSSTAPCRAALNWDLIGEHNRMNALAAIAAARHAGVPAAAGDRRAWPLRERQAPHGSARHRATASPFTTTSPTTPPRSPPRSTACAARSASARILAVLEPRSNTMKLGVMKDALPGSLEDADLVFCYGANLGWDAAAALAPLGDKARRVRRSRQAGQPAGARTPAPATMCW